MQNGKLLIARPFAWGSRPPSEHLDDEFRDFVIKTYGAPAGVSVYCGSGTPEGVARARQQQIDAFRVTPTNQIVEIDWTPRAPAQAGPSTPPHAAAPAANVMDAYHKALSAQRPASNGAPPPPTRPAVPAAPATARAAPAPTPAPSNPAPQGPATYSYCYAYGTPPGRNVGDVKTHFYVTPTFPAAKSGGLNQALEGFLRSAHPGETISASCLSPLTLDGAQANRQQTLALKRKQTAQWDVVEIDWKQ
jgi:hypothetical protein